NQLVAASVWHRPLVPQTEREKRAKQQANAAIALLKMSRPDKIWGLLEPSRDPRARSYFIHRLATLGADLKTLEHRLTENDVGRPHFEIYVGVRRALTLSLGEWSDRERFAAPVEKICELYRVCADPGLRGAAEWLLRRWGQQQQLVRIDEELASRVN